MANTPDFSLGRIELDQASRRKLTFQDTIPALVRHLSGDWGGVSKYRRAANRKALREGKPLHSIFFSYDGIKFAIVTSADRSITKVGLCNPLCN